MTTPASSEDIRALTEAVNALRADILRAAGLVAAAQLVAVDASRSEVYAHLMDEHVVETAGKILKIDAAMRGA